VNTSKGRKPVQCLQIVVLLLLFSHYDRIMPFSVLFSTSVSWQGSCYWYL